MNTTTSPPQEDLTTQAGGSRRAGLPNRSRTLTRSRDDRMIGGVASGIAGYVGVDALFVRIAFAVLAIVGGLGIPLYVACWLLIPDDGATQSIATDFASSMHEWRN
ncbi:MAG TPA: PspC domain-containing protein [Streptosporangiaceae bacterium]|jgi:phage shock protein PspC (stress-responsive transcriptional regulator)|nr:PspC domain-containing protein [Streptosporangiaceae bacterium]